MSINQAITLSGQDDIAPDEIDFPENAYFYIGGQAPSNKVLATRLDGTLHYANNDFNANSIRNDGSPITQRITCYTTEILIEGQINLASDNPILIKGAYANDTKLGIKDDVMGWYPDNITPYKIELLDDNGNLLTKVECMATDILLTGNCHFTSDVPFKIDADVGSPYKVLGIDGTGVMRWMFVENPIIPITSNLDINSLITEGYIPNSTTIGIWCKKGLQVDERCVIKGALFLESPTPAIALTPSHNYGTIGQVLGKNTSNNLDWVNVKDIMPIDANLDINSLITEGSIPSQPGYGIWCKEKLKVDKDLEVYNNIYCSESVVLNGDVVVSANSNINVAGNVGTIKQFLGKDINNKLNWLEATDVLPIDTDLDINSLITEGGIPSNPNVGIQCKEGLELWGALYLGANSNIIINGDAGGANDIIGKDANNDLKWRHIADSGMEAGLNIDPDQLDLAIIATKTDVDFVDVNITSKITINGVQGTADQIIVANADGTIRWDTVSNLNPAIQNLVWIQHTNPNRRDLEMKDYNAPHLMMTTPIPLANGSYYTTIPNIYWHLKPASATYTQHINIDTSLLADDNMVDTRLNPPIFGCQFGVDTGVNNYITGVITLYDNSGGSKTVINIATTINNCKSIFIADTDTDKNMGGTLTPWATLNCGKRLKLQIYYLDNSGEIKINMECHSKNNAIGTVAQYLAGGALSTTSVPVAP